MLRTFNNTVAEGHREEMAEQLLTEAIRRTCVLHDLPWGEGVAPEPAALTDAVVKRAFMEVAEQMHLAGDLNLEKGSGLEHLGVLVSAVATHLGESDGGERLRNDFLPVIGEAMRDFLSWLKSEYAEQAESAGLTEPVVKRAVLDVVQKMGRAGEFDNAWSEPEIADVFVTLMQSVATQLGETDGGERLRNGFGQFILDAMMDSLMKVKREKLADKAAAKAKLELELTGMRVSRMVELEKILRNPDLSGALAVLEILDRTDAARGSSEVPPGQRDASESGTSGWRHATVEDYGVAMRAALEELAESDRREIEGFRKEHDKLATELERGENGVVSLRSWGAICGS